MKTKQELLEVFLHAINLPEVYTKNPEFTQDRYLLDRAVNNEDLGPWTLLFAIQELFDTVGINVFATNYLYQLKAKYSINDVVTLAFRKQHKTEEELKEFLLSKLAMLNKYKQNNGVAKKELITDALDVKEVSFATRDLFEFAGIDAVNCEPWSKIPQNPTVDILVNIAYMYQF